MTFTVSTPGRPVSATMLHTSALSFKRCTRKIKCDKKTQANSPADSCKEVD